jgi:hypothetical protein
MSRVSRRRLLTGTAATATGIAVAGGPTGLIQPAAPAEAQDACVGTPVGPATVTPDDPRYQDLRLRGYNKRFVAQPESVRIVGSTAHVVQAVNQAVRDGKRIAIRSGGHCLEALVDDPEVQTIIDFTEMRNVAYDASRRAFVIEPGATLGETYRTLDYGWGVTLPGGVCPAVGAGGHIIGNGQGALTRQFGPIGDHLYAIEVVVVGRNGQASAVVATRETSDPNRELWWAHTGAGGGHFGVVTRFWMRSPGVSSSEPRRLLPSVPNALMSGRVVWNWADLDEASFVRLVRNYSTWLEQNSAPDSAGRVLHGTLSASRLERGTVLVIGAVDPTVPGREQILDSFLAAMGQGITPQPQLVKSGVLPWLSSTINVPDSSVAQGVLGPPRWKSKVAYAKRRYADDQISTAYRHLTRTDYAHTAASFSLTSYGGQANAPAPGDTATPHRDSIMMTSVSAAWDVAADDQQHVDWVRTFYRDLFATTGGAPVPNATNDGCHVNWPDIEMLDGPWNTSGVPWPRLAHKDNYPRLQQVKARYDPLNVFRHPLSIRPPG